MIFAFLGIGSGVGTNGQVQVFHDLLGLYVRKRPNTATYMRHVYMCEEAQV